MSSPVSQPPPFDQRPRGDEPVPAVVARLAGARPLRLVWHNLLGGLTFEAGDWFIKWSPVGSGLDLTADVSRLRWAARYTPVPIVLDAGRDTDGSWLVTTALPGESAVSPRWKAEPVTAARAIGEGLRALHDRLPVRECPFSWSAAGRLARGRRARASGVLPTPSLGATFEQTHGVRTVREAFARANDAPTIDRLVVCHADSCAPNTLIGPDGRFAGHVDLGRLGVADRWADLAIATWSLEWNYGPGWQETLLDTYEIRADQDRIAYYRLLWDLCP